MTDAPEPKVGDVWKAPGVRERRVERVYRYEDGDIWEIHYVTASDAHLILYGTWRAWVRKTGARP